MGWFLFFFGVLVGAAGVKLWARLAKSGHVLKIRHYLLGIALLIWTAYGSIFAYESFVEGETRAGWFFIMVHWGLAIIVSFLAIGMERRRPARIGA